MHEQSANNKLQGLLIYGGFDGQKPLDNEIYCL